MFFRVLKGSDATVVVSETPSCGGGEFNWCVPQDGEESQSWQRGTGREGGLSLTEGPG